MKYCVGSLILVAIKATIAVGGLGVVLERNYESGRIEAPMYIRFLCNLTICLCSMLCKFSDGTLIQQYVHLFGQQL